MIVLPWPDRRLSPNARVHYMHKARLVRTARELAGWQALHQMSAQERQAIREGDEKINVEFRFYPPDKRYRDDDNMVALVKSYRDGVADGLLVNDRRFKPVYIFEDAAKPGRIEIVFPNPQGESGNLACGANQQGLEKELAERCVNTPGLDTNAYEERDA